jgi:hypothetical protein
MNGDESRQESALGGCLQRDGRAMMAAETIAEKLRPI